MYGKPNTGAKKPDNSVGAIWVRKGQKGEFLSIRIKHNGEELNFVAFPNTRKTAENHPDWNILKSNGTPKAAAPASTGAPKAAPAAPAAPAASAGPADNSQPPF